MTAAKNSTTGIIKCPSCGKLLRGVVGTDFISEHIPEWELPDRYPVVLETPFGSNHRVKCPKCRKPLVLYWRLVPVPDKKV
jgi:phage FluMu protein Com